MLYIHFEGLWWKWCRIKNICEKQLADAGAGDIRSDMRDVLHLLSSNDKHFLYVHWETTFELSAVIFKPGANKQRLRYSYD